MKFCLPVVVAAVVVVVDFTAVAELATVVELLIMAVAELATVVEPDRLPFTIDTFAAAPK